MVVTPTRAPVLSPAPLGWRGLPSARENRLRVADGVLLHDRPGAGTHPLAAPATITRALHVDDPADAGMPRSARAPAFSGSRGRTFDQHGATVFLAGDRPVLAIRVAEWCPLPRLPDSTTDALEVSGVHAVADALGVEIESVGRADVAFLRRHGRQVTDRLVSPLPRLPRWFVVVTAIGYGALLAWLLTVVALALDLADPPLFGAMTIVMATGLLAVTAGAIALRRQAVAAAARTPATGSAVVRPRPATPLPSAFTDNAGLLITPDWVVGRDAYGREAWMPGRTLGGIASVSVNPAGDLVLTDQSARTWAVLPGHAWFSDESGREHARRAAHDAGYPELPQPPSRAASGVVDLFSAFSPPPQDVLGPRPTEPRGLFRLPAWFTVLPTITSFGAPLADPDNAVLVWVGGTVFGLSVLFLAGSLALAASDARTLRRSVQPGTTP
jgi:hypothetical protein